MTVLCLQLHSLQQPPLDWQADFESVPLAFKTMYITCQDGRQDLLLKLHLGDHLGTQCRALSRQMIMPLSTESSQVWDSVLPDNYLCSFFLTLKNCLLFFWCF